MKNIKRLSNLTIESIKSLNSEIGEKDSMIILIEPVFGSVDILQNTVQQCYDKHDWTLGYNALFSHHLDIATKLFAEGHPVFDEINDHFVEIEWQLEEEPVDDRAYFTDQVMTVLPLISAKLVFHYLKSLQYPVSFIDSRDFIVTDNSYGNGNIDMVETQKSIIPFLSVIESSDILVLPADIGCSTENYGVSYAKGRMEELF